MERIKRDNTATDLMHMAQDLRDRRNLGNLIAKTTGELQRTLALMVDAMLSGKFSDHLRADAMIQFVEWARELGYDPTVDSDKKCLEAGAWEFSSQYASTMTVKRSVLGYWEAAGVQGVTGRSINRAFARYKKFTAFAMIAQGAHYHVDYSFDGLNA